MKNGKGYRKWSTVISKMESSDNPSFIGHTPHGIGQLDRPLMPPYAPYAPGSMYYKNRVVTGSHF